MPNALDATLAQAQPSGVGGNALDATLSALQQQQQLDPSYGMSVPDKFLAGMGKAFADIGRGAGQFIPVIRNGQIQPLVTAEDVAESRRLDAPLMNNGSAIAGNITGNIAAFAPTALIPGANTITGGAAIGAATGMLQPAVSRGEMLTNMEHGAIGGAAVPALMTAGKVAKALVDPLYAGGRSNIVGKALANASAADPLQLAQTLRQTTSATPGVQYSVAEAANNPSLAALQRTATQTNPVVVNAADALQAANNTARVNVLQDLAGTQGQRSFYDSARNAAADELYGKAYSVPVEMENLSPAQRGEITKLLKMPAIQSAMKQAQTNAANYGMNINNPEGSIAGLHQAKLAMDDQISKLMNGSAAEVNKANGIQAARDRLVTFMESMSPDYQDARTTYQAMSRPINQMDTVQRLLDKSTDPLKGTIYPQAFARNLSDDTARLATGFQGSTLQNTLEPGALQALNGIKDDLVRQNFAATAGRPVGSDTVQKLAYSNLLDQAGVPSLVGKSFVGGPVGAVASKLGNFVYEDANKKLSEQLARALLNPSDAADLLQSSMVTPQMIQIANTLRRSGVALGAGGSASIPALLPADQ